ncbi:MAG: DegT/DnrJ/EryC1/StrS family aminotransferase [Lachnospiraceae bacterium]|nr:DegT/DnrJ/EryC1/StrS family aminotransferase [Lachnospiraceae bacterium]
MEFINLKRQYEKIKPAIESSLKNIMAEACFINGKEVGEFETKLAKYIGRRHCISCGNGTDALMLACLSYGIGDGDAVFCPDMTFIASIEPACMLGATPIFVDIDDKTYNLSAQHLERKIHQVKAEGKWNPRAVIMVDFLGNPADADAITDICKKNGMILIEDSAQATGAVYRGRKCGSLGDIACTSFFPSKPLGCYGDGGAVFTDDDEIADRLRSLKVHGKGESKYDNIRIGMNSRLDTIQATVLLAKLEILEEEIEKRQEIAKRYDEAFGDILQIPAISQDCRSAYAQYVLLAENGEERGRIVDAMKKADIPSLFYYPKELHRMDAFGLKEKESYSNASRYARCNFGVPFSPYLTKEEQEKVIRVVKAAVTGYF